MNLGDLLNSAAVRTPLKTAIILGNESLSYKALDQSVTLLAQWFGQSGLRKGDRIALHWSNSFETVQLYFACFRAGLIVVPINTRLKASEIAYILENSRARLCFSQPELELIAREAAATCPTLSLHTRIPELSERGMSALPDVNADEPALIIYTSGTTARPKGVTHTHRTLIGTAEGMASIGVDESQIILVLTTMMHASGLYCDLLPAILGGTTAVLAPAFEPGVVLDLIERHRCTFTVGLPTLIHYLLEEQAQRPRDVSSMRLVYGEQVVAFVSLREGQKPGEQELIEFAKTRLADYKTPERIVFLPDLPKGPTGKVQRRALKEIAI